MRGEHARFFTSGGWGLVSPPAFAYDLTKGEIYKRAQSSGLRRYGRAPGSGDDDTRPLGLAYDIEWMTGIEGTEMSPLVDSSELVMLGNAFSLGDAQGLEQSSSDANNAVSYRGYSVARNGAWSLWGYLHTPPKGQILKLCQWFWGAPGKGFVFQIRNGTAEIAGLSLAWNETEMQQLRLLWGVKKPTQAETDQTDELKKKLFVDFESLSFENNTGKGDWYGNEFMVSFVPEPRGILHIVLEGLDATAHEVKAVLKTRKTGVLWEASAITLYSAGGAFFFTLGTPLFRSQAKMSFGPFKNGYFAEHLGALTYARNVDVATGQTVTMTKTEPDEVHFGFDVNVVNVSSSSTPWIYGLSARLAPGARQPIEDVNGDFDTDVPYVPANPAAPRYDGPKILDIQPTWDGALNRRMAQITMIDMLGTTSMGKPKPNNRVATLEIGGQSFIKNGMVTSVKVVNASSLRSDLIPSHISLPDTELLVGMADGWEILNKTECDPPPIGDYLPLGTHLREFLAIAGFSSAEMAGVLHAGKRIARAALGEDFASRVEGETKCGDAIRTLFECYGLGWMLTQDNEGIWQMTKPSTLTGEGFSSSRIPDVHSEPGRLGIFRDIDIVYDTIDFFNHFVVEGEGTLQGEWTDWESILHPMSPKFLGIKKTKRVRNSGLRTEDDVDYALRSVRWRYGRGGRRAEYETNFHRRFLAGHRIPHDGVLWEIEGLSGGSWAADKARHSVFEVLQ